MPFRRIGVYAAVLLATSRLVGAQQIIESLFAPQDVPGYYGNPNNWLPPEVPNNTADRIYNVTVPDFVRVNVDATISNLSLTGSYLTEGNSLTVTGSTTLTDFQIFLASTTPAGATLSAGELNSFADGSLTGNYYLTNYNTAASWATLQFNRAHVVALTNAQLTLAGPMTRIIDEFERNALRDLASIDSSSTLQMAGQQLNITGPFLNDGILSVGAWTNSPGVFSISKGLTNFDPATRTLSSGTYYVGGSDYEAIFQFAGADIVHNATSLSLSGSLARITDLNGADGLRNFSHNAKSGILSISSRDFSIPGDFTNDGVLNLQVATFTVNGSLTNFDPTTRTLTGGTYQLDASCVSECLTSLVFRGADVVNNAASIQLHQGAKIYDENGNDALRNFAHNLPGGEFIFHDYRVFTPPADFTNEGNVQFVGDPPVARPSHFKLTAGHTYHQLGGTTSFAFANFSGDMIIDGGSFSVANTNVFSPVRSELEGNLTIGDALFSPIALAVTGAVHLSPNSIFLSNPWYINEYGYFSVTETFAANGTLQIGNPGSPPPLSTSAFAVVLAGSVNGTFSNAPNGARVATTDGLGTFVVTYGSDSIIISGYQPIRSTPQLLNLSTRAQIGTEENALVGGFILTGTQSKTIVLRALGPSLSPFVPAALADPVLEVRDSSGALIRSNDNWRSSQENQIRATGIAPTNDLESAMIVTLPANDSAYTAIVNGANGGTGIGVVEVYDVSPGLDSKPINISTRGHVRTGDDALIGGLMPLGQNPMRVIVRAIGPSLPVTGRLEDPNLILYDSNGAPLASNDNWRSDQEAEINATGIPPANDLESAIVTMLPAGNAPFTAVISGTNNSEGVALIEVYDLYR